MKENSMKNLLTILLAVLMAAPVFAADEAEDAAAKAEAELKAAVKANSETFLKLLDAKDYDGAYEWISLIARQAMRKETWLEVKQYQAEQAGKRETLDIWRITITKDPENAPMAGTYIAADYDSVFEKLRAVSRACPDAWAAVCTWLNCSRRLGGANFRLSVNC